MFLLHKLITRTVCYFFLFQSIIESSHTNKDFIIIITTATAIQASVAMCALDLTILTNNVELFPPWLILSKLSFGRFSMLRMRLRYPLASEV